MDTKIKEINKKNNIEYTIGILNDNIELLNVILDEISEIIIENKIKEINNSSITIVEVNKNIKKNDSNGIKNIIENIKKINVNKIKLSYKLTEIICVNDFIIFDNDELIKKIMVLGDDIVFNKDNYEIFNKKNIELYSLIKSYILILSNLKKNLLILIENLSLY